MNARTSLGVLALGVSTLVACGPKAVRDSDVAGLDTEVRPARSLLRSRSELIPTVVDALVSW